MYDQLRVLAARYMRRERGDHSLRPSDLVHEAYLRLVGDRRISWQSSGHFYAAAAEAMRRILIDRARRKKAIRHGGEWQRIELDSIHAPAAAPDKSEEMLALDEALLDEAGWLPGPDGLTRGLVRVQ